MRILGGSARTVRYMLASPLSLAQHPFAAADPPCFWASKQQPCPVNAPSSDPGASRLSAVGPYGQVPPDTAASFDPGASRLSALGPLCACPA